MATRKEMEDLIRKIDLEFGRDPDGDTPLEDLDADEIKEIYEEYMDNYASKKSNKPKVVRAKDGGLIKTSKNSGVVRSKPKVAGRLAKRGYGKAMKGKK